jgi:hypothetical protein
MRPENFARWQFAKRFEPGGGQRRNPMGLQIGRTNPSRQDQDRENLPDSSFQS